MLNDLKNNKPKHKTKQKKLRDNKTVNYFNEDVFRSEILPNINSPGYILPESFVNDIFAITDGMINTEFRNNTFVINNREELKQECFFEVLKSLKKFNCEKGRSFAYFNRIIKNTLLKIYYKNNRICSKEVKILDIINDYDNQDDTFTFDEALSIILSPQNLYYENSIKENTKIFNLFFDTDLSKQNAIDKKKQLEDNIDIAILHYLNKILYIINEFKKSDNYKDNFLNYIIRNADINYEIGKKNIIDIIYECEELFTKCINKLSNKIDVNNIQYTLEIPSILITHKVIVYVKNIISDKSLRSRHKKIIANPKLSALIIKELIKFKNI